MLGGWHENNNPEHVDNRLEDAVDIQSNIDQNSTGNDANHNFDDYFDPGPVPDVGQLLAKTKARNMLLNRVRKVTQKHIARECGLTIGQVKWYERFFLSFTFRLSMINRIRTNIKRDQQGIVVNRGRPPTYHVKDMQAAAQKLKELDPGSQSLSCDGIMAEVKNAKKQRLDGNPEGPGFVDVQVSARTISRIVRK